MLLLVVIVAVEITSAFKCYDSGNAVVSMVNDGRNDDNKLGTIYASLKGDCELCQVLFSA